MKTTALVLLAVGAIATPGCKKSSSDSSPNKVGPEAAPDPAEETPAGADSDAGTDGATQADDSTNTESKDPAAKSGFNVTGTIALDLGLTTAPHVTHVSALNTESGDKIFVEVDPETGAFTLPLGAGSDKSDGDAYIKEDGSVDREALKADHPEVAEQVDGMSDDEIKSDILEGDGDDASSSDEPKEPSPWVISYLDASKVGAEMIVSRFATESLDTLAPRAGAQGALDLGSVATGTPTAGMSASHDDILSAIDMSAATADAFGAIDDISLRYINPDIDNDGKLDEHKRFILDFHNRFNLKNTTDDSTLDHRQLKNVFIDDLIGGYTNLGVAFTGTGIVPEMEPEELDDTPPATYKWTFESAAELNNGAQCAENPSATTLAAGTACTQSYTVDPSYDRYQLSFETKMPPEGTYKLEAGGKTFTWTDVKVSDFSAGEGFLVLLVKYVVDEHGTSDAADDTVTGIEWKYVVKSGSTWVAASNEMLHLIVKGDGGYVAMHMTSNDYECGVTVPKESTGSITFSPDVGIHCGSSTPTDYATSFMTGAALWSDFTMAGVSYDDKLGMRFFF